MVDPADGATPLTGGRITKGIVRVGDTVRRPASTASAFSARLLRLLEERGFDGAPRHLGQDETGRDILSFVNGWVPAKFQRWTDDQLAAAGALLRALHNATRGSELAGHHEVVCHHDPGPNNVVFRSGQPVAFIDFDTAAPGSPLEDLGYMAWLFCVSSKVDAPPVEAQAAQIRVFVDAYGITTCQRKVTVDAMLERQARNARFWAEAQATGSIDATAQQFSDRIAWSQREHAYTAANRKTFELALLSEHIR
jgi:aminoglycoside phosphotransferase (APT) family kinase protein